MFIISKPTTQDFLTIAKLDRDAWLENNNGDFIPDGEHTWKMWQEHSLIYKAQIAGKIVGAILAFQTEDGSYCLHKVFTDKKYRGQGIATALFEKILLDIDGMSKDVFLTVDPENGNALKLYAKFGFTEKQFFEGFYRPEENRYVLTRKAKNNIS